MAVLQVLFADRTKWRSRARPCQADMVVVVRSTGRQREPCRHVPVEYHFHLLLFNLQATDFSCLSIMRLNFYQQIGCPRAPFSTASSHAKEPGAVRVDAKPCTWLLGNSSDMR